MTANRKAFSLLEVLVLVSTVGILASIAFLTLGDVVGKARDGKTSSDVATINRAVKIYLANGGSLDDAKTPNEVITRLKSKVSATAAGRMPGISASVVDSRLSFKPSTTGEGIVWDTTSMQFVKGGSGPDAIAEFFFDESLAEVEVVDAPRATTLQYAAQDGWIWDYEDVPLPTGPTGPSVITIASSAPAPISAVPAAITSSSPPPLPDTPTNPTSGTLSPPGYSLPGAVYSLNTYDLQISLSDPNAPGTGKVVYSIDYGQWQDYSGPVTVAAGSTLSAQIVSVDPDWAPSSKMDQYYDATPIKLAPPSISPNKDFFGLLSGTSVTITLDNPNRPDKTELRYRLNGGEWLPYDKKFTLKRWDYPDGVKVEAQAFSSVSAYYQTSSVNSRTIDSEILDLSGSASGEFHTPTGPSGMVTNLAANESSSYFEWGDDQGSSSSNLSQSTMTVGGGAFSDIAEGERFQLGSIDYYNGTIRSGSGALTIDLEIALALNINGYAFNPYFDFSFDLVNTANSGDPLNPWPDADFVYLSDTRASRTLIIDDTEFEFRLEFGETSSDGFASFNEFHVLENRSADVNIYGTLTEIGPSPNFVASGGDPSSPTSTGSAPEEVVYDPLTGEAIAFQQENYIDPEEGAKLAREAIEDLKRDAKEARELAEDYREDAKKAYDKARNADDDDYDEALAQATLAKDAYNLANSQLTIADNAVLQAKQLAADANSFATKDPAAGDEAAKALQKYQETVAEYDKALTETQEALNYANLAEAEAAARYDG